MAHRKIIELTVRVIVDVGNDDLPDSKAHPYYEEQIEARLDEFADETTVSLSNTHNATVHKAEVLSYVEVV